MSSQYGELQPANSWDRFVSLGHPSKFQQVLHLGVITAPTSLTGSQPNFARCLAISCAGTLYIHFRQLLPLDGILPGENSLCVQVLHSLIFAVLLNGTAAAGISQTLRCGTRNGITELSQRAPPIFGWASAHILLVLLSYGIIANIAVAWKLGVVVNRCVMFGCCSWFLCVKL